MKRPILFIIVLVLAGSVFAQSQSIILNTSPAPTEIDLLDGTDVLVDLQTGSVVATPLSPTACSATGGGSCDDVQVSITSLTAAPSTVEQGDNIVFSWDSRGAWSCEGTGFVGTSWMGTKLPDGSQTVSTGGVTPDDYTVALSCSNGPVDASSTVAVTVEEMGGGGGGGPVNCSSEGRLPPVGLTQDTSIIIGSTAQTITWLQTFGQAWPSGNGPDTEILNDRYASIQFTTGSAGTSGRVSFDPLQGNVDGGFKLVTMSECRGDFTPQDDNACRVLIGSGAIRYIVGTGGGAFDCNLEADTTYYLNVLYTDDDTEPYNWTCTAAPNPGSASSCGAIMSPIVN